METRRLELFLQIVEAGSINRAAANLGMAQPALSQQLAILETELKAPLVTRSSRGVEMTAAGQALYARARVILRQVESLRAQLRGGPGAAKSTVSVGIMATHMRSIGGELLARCLSEHPQIQLCIVEGIGPMLLDRLEGGLVDLAIAPPRSPRPNLAARMLFEEELLVVRPTGEGPPPDDLEGLAALPWLLTATPNMIQTLLRSAFARADAEPRVVAEVNSLPLLVDAVERGLGVTLLPQAAVAEALAAGTVEAWPFPVAPMRRTIHLIRRRDTAPTAAEQAVERLIDGIVLARPIAAPSGAEIRTSP